MDRYSIRIAKPDDVGDIFSMVTELASQNNPRPITNSVQDFAEDMSDWFHCLVAEHRKQRNETEIVGYAIWTYGYTTIKGKTTELKSFYVKPVHRGKGLGFALLQHIAKISLDKGVIRLRFSVHRDNQIGKTFYERVGARNLSETERWELMEINKQKLMEITNIICKL